MARDTMLDMGKNKKSGGEHKTPRENMQVPTDWMALARRLAAKNKQPTLWYVLSLLADAAERESEDRPALPWEIRDN